MESVQSGALHKDEKIPQKQILLVFKLEQICHVDQQKAAWFETEFVCAVLDNGQWTEILIISHLNARHDSSAGFSFSDE